jgi:biopolymer transport protein ExbD
MESSGSGGKSFTEINIIPFVDIVLVLLIIFMLTAPVIFETSIPLELPQAASVEPTADTDIGVIILADGSLVLNGTSINDVGLRQAVQENPTVRALLSADKDTPHGRVIEIIDILRQEGVHRYALNVVPSEESSAH